MEAGLPPEITVSDQIASQLHFGARWPEFAEELFDDDSMIDPLLILDLSPWQIRDLALELNQYWDHLQETYFPSDRPDVGSGDDPVSGAGAAGGSARSISTSDPTQLTPIDLTPLLSAARPLDRIARNCTVGIDKLLERIERVQSLLDSSLATLDPSLPESIVDRFNLVLKVHQTLSTQKGTYSRKVGAQTNWDGQTHLEAARDQLQLVWTPCEHILRTTTTEALEVLVARLAVFCVELAEERRVGGQLDFHDLLVRARMLLQDPRHGARVRANLRRRYHRLLIDEFQDTDPIQVDLAMLLATDPGHGTSAGLDERANDAAPSDNARDDNVWDDSAWDESAWDDESDLYDGRPDDGWDDEALHDDGWDDDRDLNHKRRMGRFDPDPGRLFFVGDPKQSIYRFRGADIATYLRTRDHVSRHSGQLVDLTTNFRSTKPVIDWVNAVFGRLITRNDNSQPDYEPLVAYHQDAPTVGPPVTVLNSKTPFGKHISAEELRKWEAQSVAHAIKTILDEGWSVRDAEHPSGRRPARAADIAILLPTRTSLGDLRDELDHWDIPHRAETSSLVYESQEVRDLIVALRALADPTDELSVVATLRSPLYGCGDDDLARWKLHHRGRFSLLARFPDEEDLPTAGNPVAEGLGHMQELLEAKRWTDPAGLLNRLILERGVQESSVASGRPREAWRKLRFVLDQARAWSDAGGRGLRNYLEWVELQGQENARVTETVLPETDDDAVRILTVHAAKGLQFPIAILSGTNTPLTRSTSPVVGFGHNGSLAIRMRNTGSRDESPYRYGVCTEGFDDWYEREQQMEKDEAVREMYVACTRARDHLVVSLARKGADVDLDAFVDIGFVNYIDPDPPRQGTWSQLLRVAMNMADTGGDHQAVDLDDHLKRNEDDPSPTLAPNSETPPPSDSETQARGVSRRQPVEGPALGAAEASAGDGRDSQAPDTEAQDARRSLGEEWQIGGRLGHRDRWVSELSEALRRSATPSTVSPTVLAKSQGADHNGATPRPSERQRALAPGGDDADPGLLKDDVDSDGAPWRRGRYGTAVGRAVHAVLQTIDLSLADPAAANAGGDTAHRPTTGHKGVDHDTSGGAEPRDRQDVATSGAGPATRSADSASDPIKAEARRQAAAEGISNKVDTVVDLVRAALTTRPALEAARSPQVWRELSVCAPVADESDVLVEGYIDLMYRDAEGRLVIVDWKTDAVDTDGVDAKLARYRTQGAAYAAAVEAATGEPVARMDFVFLRSDGDGEPSVAPIDDLRGAIDEVKQKVLNLSG